MQLHDTLETTGNIHITRVPGGWIYNYLIRNYTVFIPYNNEFNKQAQQLDYQARRAELSVMYPGTLHTI